MAIRNAVQRGASVYVYDEKGRQLFTQNAGSGPKDGLQGYTGGTVNIRRGSTIYNLRRKGPSNIHNVRTLSSMALRSNCSPKAPSPGCCLTLQ
jgi:hypothetical protein